MNFEGKFEAIGRIENGKKRGNVCREFCFVNYTIKTICKNKANCPFERNGSRIQGFRTPERSDVNEALLKWKMQDRSDDILRRAVLF